MRQTMTRDARMRAATRLLYIAIVLALIPAVTFAAIWVRMPIPRVQAITAAALPFVACLVPFVTRVRERAVTLRVVATVLLMVSAFPLFDLTLAFLPAIVAMGASAVLLL